ncbi:hypothetical protein MKJ04_15040 [Pontibacter sp. E15-1]|uniref:hypothetical protein n=1 Tax=Pontibacter sp. E15-1 TaxID=2919918 RepID=UPI001F4FA769|nr:hypothetical protein [Pontibacter sp. E15-1]MCJ8166161.1 hypothetical protein [Pontibacter sp. E15-1]
MLRILSLFIVALLFCSCEQNEKVEYYRFGKQITPSGKYVIYDYARYDPDILGTEVFKVNEEFEEGEGVSIDGAISEWISDDTLLIYNFKSDLEQPKDTLPIDTKFEKVGDFIVETVYYKSNSGSRAIYDFDSVATTNDSIIIRTVSSNGEQKILIFPLGATTIKIDSDSIKHITISTRLSKSMNFVYKNPDGSFTSGLPKVGTTWYDLTPIKKISPKGLNTKKIFWEE